MLSASHRKPTSHSSSPFTSQPFDGGESDDWPVPARAFQLLGTNIESSGFEATIRGLLAARGAGKQLSIHFTSVHLLMEAHRNPHLRDILNRPDAVVTPDGMPLVWAGRFADRPTDRVCGPDVMPALLDRGRATGARHYFYGGAEGVPELLAERMSERFPGIRVAGTWSPPFRPLTPQEDAAEVERINAAEPDYVWVGLGAPKQDFWVAEHRPKLNATALLAVGAAFDFHAGLKRQAPGWMRRNGLEWAHRLASEPRRLARRYTVVNARFIVAVAKEHAPAATRTVRSRKQPRT